MNTIQAIAVAVLQGATELFPVSSLGHAVVLPALLGWDLDQRAPAFLPFLVMLHAGTATALLLYFWRDWWGILRGLFGFGRNQEVNDSRLLFVLIVIATIPAVIVGFALEKYVRGLFASPLVAASFLAVNGLVLLLAERLRRNGHRPLAQLTARDALLIGLCQCTALIPGISRSGATIVGGLLRGIDHEGAARFSFLIATPIIIGATVLEVPKLLRADVDPAIFQMSAVAAVVAGVTAWLSTWFLMRYFRGHDNWALNPFGYYCMLLGLGSLGWLLWGDALLPFLPSLPSLG
ncbi:Undecaprenyl-diphosphatase [Rhodovastum atsumiense]|uniref:Undecaprenyl-diphosphatase n=1 Tax=Rhodovastum atsumiense TaxID=504468 RepID=A0A5M6IUW3_9PROT|nr:undecaprenyl-diphosphate phosphatase [Rhodovastum atsumiense]KAA5612062.1 undecaprenyl-diphosphate phosphatase [Rhodovastum atsumiense]CAH2604070.1 Undecaprenyl-diphosphatase [Rhodovastum atsumiense]